MGELGLGPFDRITLGTTTSLGDQVTIQFWGIPISLLSEFAVPTDPSRATIEITRAFVADFRNDLAGLTVIQDAGGRFPMIIEYPMIEGGMFKEFIHGLITPNAQCIYVSVMGMKSNVTLPDDFRPLEALIQLEM